jgi:GNAT superfamily N-acetyltransferase
MKTEILGLDRYEELVEHLDSCHNIKNIENSFSYNEYSHICPPSDDPEAEFLASCYEIALDGGRIAGAVGLFPFDLIVKRDGLRTVLKCGGVGNVSTKQEYRGAGIMDELMQSALKRLIGGGYEVSWMEGDRFRYQRYGYDIGGKKVVYHFTRHDLAKFFQGDPSSRKAENEDIPVIAPAYDKLEAGAIRNMSLWKRYLVRHGFDWTITPEGGYFCSLNRDPSRICEFCPGAEQDIGALLAHMIKHEIDQVTVDSPASGPYHDWLSRYADGVSIHACEKIMVVDPEAVSAKLAPLFGGNCPPLEHVFGFDKPYNDNSLPRLDWWLSKVDYI